MAAYVFKLYRRPPGIAQGPQLVDEVVIRAVDAHAAVVAARARCKAAGGEAAFARLSGPDNNNIWCADGPFE
jgi:hypothetical protein